MRRWQSGPSSISLADLDAYTKTHAREAYPHDAVVVRHLLEFQASHNRIRRQALLDRRRRPAGEGSGQAGLTPKARSTDERAPFSSSRLLAVGHTAARS